MASNITLSAGVRQNLLSLQDTASLMGLTQNRLATGKKVNSALDNPSNFFTSQSLNNRASDLNSLLDSIGQAQKTLEAADKGLTSLTKLVESAKSIAKQARQASQPTSSYAAVNVANDISAAANLNGDEVIGTVTGSNANLASFDPVAINKTFTNQSETAGSFSATSYAAPGGAGGNIAFSVTVNGTAYNLTAAVGAADAVGAVQTAIQNAIDGNANTTGHVTVGTSGGFLTVTADDADTDISITASAITANVGLTADASTNRAINSTSLLDRVVAAGGTAGTSSITINDSGQGDQVITFGYGSGEVSTIDELNTKLQALTGGVSASISGTTLSFSKVAGASNTLTLTASDAGVNTALGTSAARSYGQTGGLGTGLTRTFNSQATLADSDPTNLLSGGSLTISVNGSAQSISLSGSDHIGDVISKLQANATLNNNLDFTDSSGNLKITAKNADVDFVITDNNSSRGLGLTTNANVTVNSTSLLDRLNTSLGGGNAGQGTTLTVSGNGGQTQTLTFGTGSNEISTKAELTTALASLSGGITGTLTGTSLSFQVAAGSSQTSLTFGGTAAAKFGFTPGTTNGAVSSTTDNSTRAALQNDYNDVLTQIDTLAKDSSYNGINLLNGDNLKVVFNEKGTSTLTISGVTFGSTGLGLSSVSGTAFQDDDQIDTTIDSLDTALSTLRTQSSKFGSSLTTVQTRQDFTKQLINTLQTGADALVLADTNEEGANLLALQTRQQLSSTALSLSAQADQAVLRLF